MKEPLICAIMLTRNRPAMAARAVIDFNRQSYQNKRLLVVNSGPAPLFTETDTLREPCFVGIDTLSIGALRNHAARYASTHYTTSDDRPEIFIHWDDDDYSHPNRISEQVALLQASGKQCVGYRSVLFLDERSGEAWKYMNNDPRYCIGSSLAYYRATWERKPFKDISRGEDREFLRDIESIGADSIVDGDPRMVCSIHSGNHVAYQTTSANWTRVPLWDSRLRERMTL